MSRSRRFFQPEDDRAYRGPSDEMLAVDAASEMRSMTLLYERWADRLYRYFLLSTGDPETADRMLRDLITRLPTDLQRFAGSDRSFAGWLFARASEVFWREYSLPSRMYRRVSRYIPSRSASGGFAESDARSTEPVPSGFDEISVALKALTPDRREVLGIHIGASLRTAPAAEALKLPASLMSSHIEWSLQSLGEQLDVTNIRRLSEDLSELINRQTLTNQQRQRHFSIIHGVFLGDVELETDEPERAPVFEIAALVGVVIVGLVGIWAWGLITEGDTREHDVASEPQAQTAGEPDPTATPLVEPPDDDDQVVMADGPAACMAADGKAHFDRFVGYFNDGDFDGLAGMLPGEDVADSGDVGPEEQSPESFWRHGGTAIADAETALEFLQERHDAGERWDVLEAYPAEHYRNWRGAAPLEMYQDWKRENPRSSMIIVAGLDWSAEQDSAQIAQGRVVIDCDAGIVTDWDIQLYGEPDAELVSLSDYISAAVPLQPGEIRQTVARIRVDGRPDQGLLQTWELDWAEAVLEDGASAERIEIRTLDGSEEIRFVQEGGRWVLDQRGWRMYGDNDPPFPDEIALALPWLRDLPEHIDFLPIPDDIDGVRLSFTRDVSDDSLGGVERDLELDLVDGRFGAIRVREFPNNGERVRPEIQLLSVTRSPDLFLDDFRVVGEPPFPELETDAPRYQVPAEEWEELRIVSLIVGGEQDAEQYRIRWNDVVLDLTVRPSRGGLDVDNIPPSIDDSWIDNVAEYRWGQMVWVYRHFAGYPTDALWDDGRHRFSLSVSREASTLEGWDLDELIELANALSASEQYQGDEAGPSGAGSGAGTSRESMTYGPVAIAAPREF